MAPGAEAMAILCLSSVAVTLSPITDIVLASISHALFALVPAILGYGGLMWGIYKLRRSVPAT